MGSNAAADPPLKVGDEVLLLLSWDEDANAALRLVLVRINRAIEAFIAREP
jgi:hypothetical protein